MLLAGDIGGTKTNLAIYASRDDLRTPLREAKFPSARYTTLAALVHDFLSQIDLSKAAIEQAVFGVAGPVVNGKAKITNLPWQMEEKQLQQTLNIPSVALLNDLAAMAHAVPLLREADLFVLNTGKQEPRGTKAIIAPGTGLGEALLTWDGEHYRVHPSEGGHADFAPTNAFEVGLLIYMLERKSHVSYEHVCSGIGLPNIYAYLRDSKAFEEPEWLKQKLTQAEDKTPVIAGAAAGVGEQGEERQTAAICSATMRAFTSILGAECGNMALKVLATGGVYLGGGIPPRVLSLLQEPEFMHAFKNKGRFSDMLGNLPVYVILQPDVGLMGAAAYGFNI